MSFAITGLPANQTDDYADTIADTTAPKGQLAIGGSAGNYIQAAISSIPVSSTGTIEAGADQDLFAISLIYGQDYIFDVTGGTLTDPTLTLRDANGTELRSNDDIRLPGNLNSRIEFMAPSSGTYYLDVGSYGEGTGTYTLSARADDVADDIYTSDHYNAAPLNAMGITEGWRSGVISSGADQDFYAVSLWQGQRYSFHAIRGSDTSSGTALSNPTLTLRDASGNQLAYNDDAAPGDWDAHIDFTAPSTGTYYLDVGGYGEAVGAYLFYTG